MATGGYGNVVKDINITGINVSNVAFINRTDFSGTQTSSSNSGTLDTAGFGCLTYEIIVTAASGTSPTLQFSLQASDDGSNWTEFTNTFRFTTTGSHRHQRLAIGGRYYRYAWTITGTSPSFTFSILTTLKNYLPRRSVTITRYADVVIDVLNSVSTPFAAADSSRVALVSVRSDDGGSSCQFKVQGSNDMTNYVDLTGNIPQARGTTVLTEFADKAFRFYQVKITAAANTANSLDLFWSTNS